MITKIRKIGNSSGIILSKKFLEDLKILPMDDLEVTIENDAITIRKATGPRQNWREQFLAAGSQDRNDFEMDFENNFDDEEWTW